LYAVIGATRILILIYHVCQFSQYFSDVHDVSLI
jgi:hypothetical protein